MICRLICVSCSSIWVYPTGLFSIWRSNRLIGSRWVIQAHGTTRPLWLSDGCHRKVAPISPLEVRGVAGNDPIQPPISEWPTCGAGACGSLQSWSELISKSTVGFSDAVWWRKASPETKTKEIRQAWSRVFPCARRFFFSPTDEWAINHWLCHWISNSKYTTISHLIWWSPPLRPWFGGILKSPSTATCSKTRPRTTRFSGNTHVWPPASISLIHSTNYRNTPISIPRILWLSYANHQLCQICCDICNDLSGGITDYAPMGDYYRQSDVGFYLIQSWWTCLCWQYDLDVDIGSTLCQSHSCAGLSTIVFNSWLRSVRFVGFSNLNASCRNHF